MIRGIIIAFKALLKKSDEKVEISLENEIENIKGKLILLIILRKYAIRSW